MEAWFSPFRVSTHSRPKAAAVAVVDAGVEKLVSTHSRPKAAAYVFGFFFDFRTGFNTQPPEGGCKLSIMCGICVMSFNTQPPEGGCPANFVRLSLNDWFQHTAARRRLQPTQRRRMPKSSFNTQPPEGGCTPQCLAEAGINCFNTQPPEGGCPWQPCP